MAKPQRLTNDHKLLIVQCLARFMGPSETADVVHEEFGLKVTPQAILKYDPTKAAGRELGPKFKALFASLREAYTSQVAQHGIAHEAYRLERLQRMAAEAEKRKNYLLAAQLLEQAAKERGGLYTNRRELKIDDKRKALADLLGVSPEQLPATESIH